MTDCDAALRDLSLSQPFPSLTLVSVRRRACDCLVATTAPPVVASSAPDGNSASAQFSATVSRCINAAMAAEPLPDVPGRTVRALAAIAESPGQRRFVPAKFSIERCEKRPEYPVFAARAEATGTTRLAFHVGAKGDLLDGRIVRSAGKTLPHKLLDLTALLSLMQCGFTSATLDGEAIEGSALVEYVWRLE